jgi:hypothetical protein
MGRERPVAREVEQGQTEKEMEIGGGSPWRGRGNAVLVLLLLAVTKWCCCLRWSCSAASRRDSGPQLLRVRHWYASVCLPAVADS